MNQEKEPHLVKSFGLKIAIILVVSSVIGSGVFKKVAPMAADLHTPFWVVAAWALAGLVVLFGVLSISELGALFPQSGGPFVWLEKVYGKTISFLYGWTSFTIIQTAAISSVAFIFAGALDYFIPMPHLSASWEGVTLLGVIQPFDNLGAKLVAIVLIVILTFINLKGAKQGASVSMVFTSIIVLCIVLISVVSIYSGKGSMETFRTNSSQLPTQGWTLFAFISALIIAMRSAFWGYEGWISLGFIGEELQEPNKTLPRAMLWGVVLITGLYVLINFAYLYVMPIDEMLAATAQNENSIPAVLVMDKIFGDNGAVIISGMILLSTLGCTNATILASSRIYYAMAQKKVFFKKAALCHPVTKVPSHSLIYQCVWACVLVLSGSFDLLTDLVVIASFTFYGLIVSGVFILRVKMKNVERPFKAVGYPILPALFVAFCILLLCISLIESPWQSLIGLCLICSGLPFYWYWNRKANKSSTL